MEYEPQLTSLIERKQNQLGDLALEELHDLSTYRKGTRYFSA